MKKGASIFGIFIVFLFFLLNALSEKTLDFILLYIALPVIGLIIGLTIVYGLIMTLIILWKKKNNKPEKK